MLFQRLHSLSFVDKNRIQHKQHVNKQTDTHVRACFCVCVQTSKLTATKSEEETDKQTDTQTDRETNISTVAQIRAQVILTWRTAGRLHSSDRETEAEAEGRGPLDLSSSG